MELPENPSQTDLIAYKVLSDARNKTNIEYIIVIEQKISLMLELIDSLYTDKIAIDEWLIWSEPVIFKLGMHSASYLNIYRGVDITIRDRILTMFDEPSSLVLFRVILENYLTFFYLFCDSISNDEKKFRVSVWKYSGLKQRNGFETTTEEHKLKKEIELKEIEQLKQGIVNSPFFETYNEGFKKQLIDGFKPRTTFSWDKLIQNSNLKKELFSKLYGYKSNYTHSEFISALQIKSQGYGFNLNSKEHYGLFLHHSIICKCILDMVNLFPSISLIFNSMDNNLALEVVFLAKFSSNQNK